MLVGTGARMDRRRVQRALVPPRPVRLNVNAEVPTPFVLPWSWYIRQRLCWQLPKLLSVTVTADGKEDGARYAALAHEDCQFGLRISFNQTLALEKYAGYHLVSVERANQTELHYTLSRKTCPCSSRECGGAASCACDRGGCACGGKAAAAVAAAAGWLVKAAPPPLVLSRRPACRKEPAKEEPSRRPSSDAGVPLTAAAAQAEGCSTASAVQEPAEDDSGGCDPTLEAEAAVQQQAPAQVVAPSGPVTSAAEAPPAPAAVKGPSAALVTSAGSGVAASTHSTAAVTVPDTSVSTEGVAEHGSTGREVVVDDGGDNSSDRSGDSSSDSEDDNEEDGSEDAAGTPEPVPNNPFRRNYCSCPCHVWQEYWPDPDDPRKHQDERGCVSSDDGSEDEEQLMAGVEWQGGIAAAARGRKRGASRGGPAGRPVRRQRMAAAVEGPGQEQQQHAGGAAHCVAASLGGGGPGRLSKRGLQYGAGGTTGVATETSDLLSQRRAVARAPQAQVSAMPRQQRLVHLNARRTTGALQAPAAQPSHRPGGAGAAAKVASVGSREGDETAGMLGLQQQGQRQHPQQLSQRQRDQKQQHKLRPSQQQDQRPKAREVIVISDSGDDGGAVAGGGGPPPSDAAAAATPGAFVDLPADRRFEDLRHSLGITHLDHVDQLGGHRSRVGQLVPIRQALLPRGGRRRVGSTVRLQVVRDGVLQPTEHSCALHSEGHAWYVMAPPHLCGLALLGWGLADGDEGRLFLLVDSQHQQLPTCGRGGDAGAHPATCPPQSPSPGVAASTPHRDMRRGAVAARITANAAARARRAAAGFASSPTSPNDAAGGGAVPPRQQQQDTLYTPTAEAGVPQPGGFGAGADGRAAGAPAPPAFRTSLQSPQSPQQPQAGGAAGQRGSVAEPGPSAPLPCLITRPYAEITGDVLRDYHGHCGTLPVAMLLEVDGVLLTQEYPITITGVNGAIATEACVQPPPGGGDVTLRLHGIPRACLGLQLDGWGMAHKGAGVLVLRAATAPNNHSNAAPEAPLTWHEPLAAAGGPEARGGQPPGHQLVLRPAAAGAGPAPGPQHPRPQMLQPQQLAAAGAWHNRRPSQAQVQDPQFSGVAQEKQLRSLQPGEPMQKQRRQEGRSLGQDSPPMLVTLTGRPVCRPAWDVTPLEPTWVRPRRGTLIQGERLPLDPQIHRDHLGGTWGNRRLFVERDGYLDGSTAAWCITLTEEAKTAFVDNIPKHAQGCFFLSWGRMPGGSLVLRVSSRPAAAAGSGTTASAAGGDAAAAHTAAIEAARENERRRLWRRRLGHRTPANEEAEPSAVAEGLMRSGKRQRRMALLAEVMQYAPALPTRVNNARTDRAAARGRLAGSAAATRSTASRLVEGNTAL